MLNDFFIYYKVLLSLEKLVALSVGTTAQNCLPAAIKGLFRQVNLST